jgi:uncharacterized membrane protein
MLITFIIAMVPVVELRGAIPIGISLGLPHLTGAITAVIGNLIPIPFIILFSRRVIAWMKRKSRRLKSLAERFENKAIAKKSALYRGEIIGLLIFVALPLPGTGAWTGALIAAVFGIRMRAAMPAIAAGVVIAGVLVTGITFGFQNLMF